MFEREAPHVVGREDDGRPGHSRRAFLLGSAAVLAAGAVLRSTTVSQAQATSTVYRVPGQPFDSATGFNVGPSRWNSVYGRNRQFFPIRNGDRWGVVWQSQSNDAAEKGQIFATWFGPDPNAAENTVKLQQTDEMLAAAASDDAGTIYTFTVQPGEARENVARRTTLTRRAADGTTNSANPDAGPEAMNIAGFADDNTGGMQVANGQIGLMISRTMHRSNDGLNHQSGIARVFDANTLALTKSHGQTSSHSFASMLSQNAQGQFVAIELGDNFPRGVQIHRFDAQNSVSRLVYAFKTQHGDTPQSPAGQTFPVYQAISGGGKTFYQWSNDNQTYTEIGAVVETAAGYLVVFAGERPSLDSSKVGDPLNVGRDLGAVVVRKDFEAAASLDDAIVTAGPVETGGFYGFTGRFVEQRTKGVVWFTNYPADKTSNATRINAAALPNGDAVLLWEVWGPTAYRETYSMVVRPEGTGINVVRPATSLGTTLRLNPRDDVFTANGRVYVVSGNGPNRQLIVTVVDGSGAVVGAPAPAGTGAGAAPTATQQTAAAAVPTATTAPQQAAPPPPTPTPPAAAAPGNAAPATPLGMDQAIPVAGNILGGFATNAGDIFFDGWGANPTATTVTGSLTGGGAGVTGNYLLTGTVTGPTRLTGTVTRDPAGADKWPFDITFSADFSSFTGSITGLVPNWTGGRNG